MVNVDDVINFDREEIGHGASSVKSTQQNYNAAEVEGLKFNDKIWKTAFRRLT